MARYALSALLGLVLLVGAMLLVRPLIFSVAPERGDAAYAVAPAADLGTAPLERDLLLNTSHGLPGERPDAGHVALRVIISRPPAGGVAAVNAWSTSGRCAVQVAGDRLRDCRGATWTFSGFAIAAQRPLQRFPAAVRSGAVIVDFTRPIDAS